MNDLELGIDDDLVINNGTFKLLNDEARVAGQSIEISLKTYLGEWFLNLEVGIPYFQSILKKGVDKSLPDSLFRRAILNSYNIEKIIEFQSSLEEGKYKINNFKALSLSGEIVSITNLFIT